MTTERQATTFDASPLTNQTSLADAYRALRKFKSAWQVGFVTLLIVTFVPLIIFVTLASHILKDGGALLLLIVIAGGGLYGLLDLYREINEQAIAYRFATANGMDMYRDGTAPGYAGSPFKKGIYIPYLIRTRSAAPVEFGYLRPDYAQRRSNKSTTHTYIRIKLPYALPHIILQLKATKTMAATAARSTIISDQPVDAAALRLEGEFGDTYTLHTPKGGERDALYIFTPDVMARFIDAFGDFDCEIVGDELYFYSYQKITIIKPANLQKLVAALDYVMPKFASQSGKYAAASTRLAVRGIDTANTEQMTLKPGAAFYVIIGVFVALIGTGLVLFVT